MRVPVEATIEVRPDLAEYRSAMPVTSPSRARTRSAMRSLSSAAARSVNVNATMFAGVMPSSRLVARICATRSATTCVLPDPAHAMLCKLWSIVVMAWN